MSPVTLLTRPKTTAATAKSRSGKTKPVFFSAEEILPQLLHTWDACAAATHGACVELPAEVELAAPVAELFPATSLQIRVDPRGATREGTWTLREARLGGLWIAQEHKEGGTIIRQALYLGPCPQRVASSAAAASSARVAALDAPAPGLTGMWRQLHQGSAAPGRRTPWRAYNLSQIDLDAADRNALDLALGQGPVSGSLDGLHLTRVRSTSLPRVWRVQYLSAAGHLLLDTLEIGALPECFTRLPEDLAASVAALRRRWRSFAGKAAAA